MCKKFENSVFHRLISVAFGNKVMNTPKLSQPIKRHEVPKYGVGNNVQGGRSMIEMLGVLAIIGVLSVGGIAGYSKAMSMYKLDKWSSNLTQVIVETQAMYMNQKSFGDTVKDITETLIESGVIPQGMLDANRKDLFGNRLQILTRYWAKYGIRLHVYHQMPAGKDAVACCKKLYEMGQVFNSNWVVWNENFGYAVCGKAAPTEYAKDMGCQPYSLAKVAELCKKCELNRCGIVFLLDNTSF